MKEAADDGRKALQILRDHYLPTLKKVSEFHFKISAHEHILINWLIY